MQKEVAEMMRDFHDIYGELADEESKEIYLNRLNYIITGNTGYMKHIVEKYVQELRWAGDYDVSGGGANVLAQALPADRPIILYGAGNTGAWLAKDFSGLPNFIGFCDRDVNRQTNGWCGHKVISPNALLRDHREASIVLTTVMFADEMEKFLLENDIPSANIWRIDEYVPMELPDGYFDMPFLRYEEREIFVDAGSFDLYSTVQMQRHCPHLEKVFAFEPDLQNFQRMQENKRRYDLPQAELYNCGTWSKKETLRFHAASTTGSRIDNHGEVAVDVDAIDNIVGGVNVTFIKMDVEGAEMESLKGAQRTIVENKPKLAICIYHKPEDMVEIPLYIKSLVPEYRLYVRHLGNVPWETVMYAVL